MSTEPLRWITEVDVCAVMDLPEAVGTLRADLSHPEDQSWIMEKTDASWGEGHTLHAIGGGIGGGSIVGTKTWAHTAGGATPLVNLWDGETGGLVAVIEAFALGQLRTAAVTGVATDALAPRAASVAALAGTGRQALPQAAAMCAVRDLVELRVWSPSPERREGFAAAASTTLGIDVVPCETVQAAVYGAEIVTTITRARAPFLSRVDVGDIGHVNAIGAITLERCELAPDLVGGADLVVADSPAAATSRCGELVGYPADAITPLVEIMREGVARPAGLTIFKAMGVGVADVALGAEVLRRCVASGLGQPIPHPQQATPRLLRRSQ